MRRGSRAFACLGAALLATLLATGLGLVGGPAGAPVALAATPELAITSAATYDVLPADGRVAVTAALTATNHLQDTKTKRFYFRTAFLSVLPGTSNFRIKGTSGAPKVAVSKRTSTYTVLRIDLGSNLPSGQSRALTLTFDLKDPGGAPDRPIRISPSLVSFYAWAFATAGTPGSSVTLTFPSGYHVEIGRGPLDGPTTTSGRDRWTSGRLADPLAFVADVTADRPGDYAETPEAVTVGSTIAELQLRAWPDDPAWRDRVADLMTRGLPVLATSIGVPWRLDRSLVVQEALPRSTGGYAGLFDPTTNRIEVAYAAAPGVILHEAAHAWFNGRLVADRWVAEAFATYYAAEAATSLHVDAASPVLTDAKRAAAIPLNAWGPVGAEAPDREAYAYAASLVLARAVADRAGAANLATVWQRAAADLPAYQAKDLPAEHLGQPVDWRGLLDLLDETSGKSFDDLWRTWVLRPEDMAALSERSAARDAYARFGTEVGDWHVPAAVRTALRAWRFDDAQVLIADAEAVLRQRAALTREAANAGVTLPPTMRTAFEGGDLATAAGESGAELAAIGQIEAAQAAEPHPPSALQTVGLLFTAPQADLAGARDAFAKGDLQGASNDATRAADIWHAASELGQRRLVSGVLLLGALVLLIGLVAQGVRRRRPASA